MWRRRQDIKSQARALKPPYLVNLSLAEFTFGGRVAKEHQAHAWQFEFKLGDPLAAAQRTTWLLSDVSKPIRTQCESPLQPFCLCYPLFCKCWNEFWRFTANMASTSATGGTSGGKGQWWWRQGRKWARETGVGLAVKVNNKLREDEVFSYGPSLACT
ncbi:hypothetical protein E2C01_053610 [Portunus trituberculatus]|uniref:Uncharacterized protein n=1 Tax=Portunus trituberculatus TaxID=210409 RepID=A0A5B7GPW6_PORTR|nr:hypothetical protein [Portunus trituberculatus]